MAVISQATDDYEHGFVTRIGTSQQRCPRRHVRIAVDQGYRELAGIKQVGASIDKEELTEGKFARRSRP